MWDAVWLLRKRSWTRRKDDIKKIGIWVSIRKLFLPLFFILENRSTTSFSVHYFKLKFFLKRKLRKLFSIKTFRNTILVFELYEICENCSQILDRENLNFGEFLLGFWLTHGYQNYWPLVTEPQSVFYCWNIQSYHITFLFTIFYLLSKFRMQPEKDHLWVSLSFWWNCRSGFLLDILN